MAIFETESSRLAKTQLFVVVGTGEVIFGLISEPGKLRMQDECGK